MDWFVVRRGISPPAGGELLCPRRQSHQNAAGDAADGHFVPIGPLSPDPVYGGCAPASRQKISGAQNLSGVLPLLPAHWGLTVPKLRPVRFPFRAWLCRAGDSWSVIGGRPKGLPYPNSEKVSLKPVGEGLTPPDVPRYGGPVWDRPLRNGGRLLCSP